MRKFINEHPYITLFIVEALCETVVRIVRPEMFYNRKEDSNEA